MNSIQKTFYRSNIKESFFFTPKKWKKLSSFLELFKVKCLNPPSSNFPMVISKISFLVHHLEVSLCHSMVNLSHLAV